MGRNLIERMTTLSVAFQDVIDERKRHVSEEGWTSQRVDLYEGGELARAASCYVLCAANGIKRRRALQTHQEFVAEYTRSPTNYWCWPWMDDHWKPESPRRDLVRAAAFLIAEIERIDRRGDSVPDDPHDPGLDTSSLSPSKREPLSAVAQQLDNLLYKFACEQRHIICGSSDDRIAGERKASKTRAAILELVSRRADETTCFPTDVERSNTPDEVVLEPGTIMLRGKLWWFCELLWCSADPDNGIMSEYVDGYNLHTFDGEFWDWGKDQLTEEEERLVNAALSKLTRDPDDV